MFNLLNQFIAQPENSVIYQGAYNPLLVVLSISVAILASYASLMVSQHLTAITNKNARRLWMTGGGLCLGLGVWAMHFVGMIAFSLPCTSIYDPTITFLSMIPSILASILAVKIISRIDLSTKQLANGGLLIGLGIGAMHYSGMAAMHLNGMIRYDIKLFLLSILVAVALATLALWIKFGLKSWKGRWNTRVTILSAIVMGLAVSGMHYTAMAAAYFINTGEATNLTTGISPTYLAANVLVATSLIIVITLVATFYDKHSEFSIIRSYKLIGSLIFGWLLISWFGADYFFNHLSEDLLKQESVRATEKLNNITNNINKSLELLKGAAQVVTHEQETIRVLHRYGPNVVPSSLDYEKRKQVWTKDKVLATLSNSLGYASPRLGAELILIVNAAGDCIASSNIGEAGSLVGLNFADRLYFKQARSGQQGQQYAVGRATNIPGLYFSSPVFESGRFIGAVVVKREVRKLADWTKQANIYITDANGVIVMAPEKQFEFRYMPDSPAATLSSKDKLLLYKRNDLEPLKLTPWGNIPSVVLIDDNFPPVLFRSKILDENAISIYVHTPLDELERFGAEKYWLFLLLATAGNMMIIAFAAVITFMRESQKLNAELRITASAFESDEGILVTNANNEILRVNRTFTAITGYSADEVVGKNPRMFSSGRHSTEFFTSMWDRIFKTGTWEGELWNRRKNGDEYPEFIIITAVKNNDGEVTNYVATFSDITERIKSETALNDAHQKLFSLLNSMAEGAYGVDINGNCTFVNRSFLRILGYEHADEIIGRHIHELIHHSHPDGSPYPSVECKMYKAYRQNHEIHVSDEVFWSKSGIAIPVEYWSQPIVVDNVMQGAIATFIDVTERKELENALTESELRYRTIADYTSDWEYWIMPDDTFNYVSPSSVQICGYSPDDFYADPSLLLRIIYPEDLQLYTGHVHKITSQGFAEPIDLRIRTKDGQIRWISHVCRPVFDSAGNHIGQRASNRDIHERKLAEQKIADSEALWSFALEGAGDGVWDWDLKSGKVKLSKAGAAMFDYEQDEVTRDMADWYALLPPEEQLRWQEMLRHFFHEKAEKFSLEYRVLSKKGDFIWILTRGIVVDRSADGRVSRMIGVHSNITSRKLSEELLRKSAEEIEDLYNHAPCGYHSLDKDGVIRQINDTELYWLGYKREEVVGKLKMSDLLAPSSRQAFQKNFVLLKKHGFIKDHEIELVRKDGSILYGLVNSTIIVDANNEYLSNRSTVFDITDRKKTEDTLRSLFAALEHSPIAVIITDSDANILYVSPRFTEITGYPASEVRGSNLRILQAGNIETFTYLAMWDALTEGKSWHGELLNKNKQGRAYWEDVQISPVKTPNGDISNYVVVSADISERKSIEEKMRHLATYDSLTDLPNRSLVNDRMQQALSVAKRDKTHMALMFLDLDKFKPINDTLGHNIGDLLLMEASKRMQGCVRGSDTVGRIGGDEFVMLLPTVDSGQDAILVAEKIRHALNQPFVIAGNNLSISSSIGLAIYPEHGDDVETLIKNADTAMYYAKEAGRNNVQMFSSNMKGSEK